MKRVSSFDWMPYFLRGGMTMKIINKQTGLTWEVLDKGLLKRLLDQEHYEKVKVNPKTTQKKPATIQKKE